MTKDQDLIEGLVRKEETISCSTTPVTQLNRPANAGYNPSSSNNQSNNGYRKKEHVQQAQRAYDKKLRLNLVGDEEGEEHECQGEKFPLHLPIASGSQDDLTRIIDIFLHHRTQQLMCLEFDLTHLKLDAAEDSSFSCDYSDVLSINPSSSGADASD